MNHPERRNHHRANFNRTEHCRLQHLNSGEVFEADMVDLSIKGMRLKFSPENDINQVADNPGNLQILKSAIENPTITLHGRTLIVIWRDGLELGCIFVD